MEAHKTLNSNLEKEKVELQESGSLTSYYRKKSYSSQNSVALAQTEILAFPQALGVKGGPRARTENKNKLLGNT